MGTIKRHISAITIEQYNYFGHVEDFGKLNAKVLYKKYGKLYICHVHMDFFNRDFIVIQDGAKENKALTGFRQAFHSWLLENNKI